MTPSVIPIGKKIVAGDEYFAIQSGWQYIIAKKVISGTDLAITYFISNKSDFTTAWATPAGATYAEYNQAAEVNMLEIITAMDSLTPASSVSLPSTTRTVTRTVVSASGSVASGARSVTLELSSDFAGSILGDNDTNNGGTITPGASYNFAVNQNDDKLGAIIYTRSAGTITITKIV